MEGWWRRHREKRDWVSDGLCVYVCAKREGELGARKHRERGYR